MTWALAFFSFSSMFNNLYVFFLFFHYLGTYLKFGKSSVLRHCKLNFPFRSQCNTKEKGYIINYSSQVLNLRLIKIVKNIIMEYCDQGFPASLKAQVVTISFFFFNLLTLELFKGKYNFPFTNKTTPPFQTFMYVEILYTNLQDQNKTPALSW